MDGQWIFFSLAVIDVWLMVYPYVVTWNYHIRNTHFYYVI